MPQYIGPTIEGVRESLDTLGKIVGSILVRGPDGWTVLLPGPEGYVLTTHGENELPTWEPRS
jgi:hypothetical protein